MSMSAAELGAPAASLLPRVLRDGVAVAATALAIVALALLPLLTPWAMHAVLDAAGSPGWLGTDPTTTHQLSDRTVDELVFGPGTWHLVGPDGAPFYDESEVGHLRDVRQLLWLTFLVGGLAALLLLVLLERAADQDDVVAAIGLGGATVAVAVVVIGLVGLIAFDPLFELFHRVFFPEGNWAFDPRSQRLVRLYPLAFWQIMGAALGVVMVLLGAATWVAARVVLDRRRAAW
jgi:integral membrane protein (TIGR01906 family)